MRLDPVDTVTATDQDGNQQAVTLQVAGSAGTLRDVASLWVVRNGGVIDPPPVGAFLGDPRPAGGFYLGTCMAGPTGQTNYDPRARAEVPFGGRAVALRRYFGAESAWNAGAVDSMIGVITTDLSRGRATVLSVKCPMWTVGGSPTGGNTAVLDDLLTRWYALLDAQNRVGFFSPQHEPENPTKGNDPDEWLALFPWIRGRLDTLGVGSRIHLGPIFMGATLAGQQQAPWLPRYVTAATYSQWCGVDYYAKGTNKLNRPALDTIVSLIASTGKPALVGEFGQVRSIGATAWLDEVTTFVDRCRTEGWIGACYFDSGANSTEAWPLSTGTTDYASLHPGAWNTVYPGYPFDELAAYHGPRTSQPWSLNVANVLT